MRPEQVNRQIPPFLMDDIQEFHEKFGMEYRGAPRNLQASLADFRTKFMHEELREYEDADDLEGVDRLEQKLDALVDLVYVALGTAYLHGFNFDEAWRRVHAANMKKVRASTLNQGKRDAAHDVVKPIGWTAPVLTDLVMPSEDQTDAPH